MSTHDTEPIMALYLDEAGDLAHLLARVED